MASLKRWRQIGQGEFRKWQTPGQQLEGTWRGTHPGRFEQPLGTVETSEGLVTFPLHSALGGLKEIRLGTEILIRYTGDQTSRAGRTFKSFEVFVAGDDARKPSVTPAAPRVAATDEV